MINHYNRFMVYLELYVTICWTHGDGVACVQTTWLEHNIRLIWLGCYL